MARTYDDSRPAALEPDPVIEAFKKDVDRTLLRRNLGLTVEERLRALAECSVSRGNSAAPAARSGVTDPERLLRHLRGVPPGLPFRWDEATIRRGLNFTLTTDLGDLDLLGEIVGGGTYEDLLTDSAVIQVFGIECQCLGLARLIHVKRAAGRPKDLEAIAELEALLEERRRPDE